MNASFHCPYRQSTLLLQALAPETTAENPTIANVPHDQQSVGAMSCLSFRIEFNIAQCRGFIDTTQHL